MPKNVLEFARDITDILADDPKSLRKWVAKMCQDFKIVKLEETKEILVEIENFQKESEFSDEMDNDESFQRSWEQMIHMIYYEIAYPLAQYLIKHPEENTQFPR